MTDTPYELNYSEDRLLFEFESVGEKKVSKLIEYTALAKYPNVYNLAFGDKLPDGKIDDMVITNNGDMEKVFATVINSMKIFLSIALAKSFFSRAAMQ